EMEGKLSVAEAVHLLDDQDPQDLLAAEPSHTAIGPRRAAGDIQILQDQLCDRRIVVKHARHGLQLFSMVKIEPGLTQSVLGFASFAHSGWPLFLAKFSRIKGLATPILEI